MIPVLRFVVSYSHRRSFFPSISPYGSSRFPGSPNSKPLVKQILGKLWLTLQYFWAKLVLTKHFPDSARKNNVSCGDDFRKWIFGILKILSRTWEARGILMYVFNLSRQFWLNLCGDLTGWANERALKKCSFWKQFNMARIVHFRLRQWKSGIFPPDDLWFSIYDPYSYLHEDCLGSVNRLGGIGRK